MTDTATDTPPAVPPRVRTGAYIVGIIAGLAIAPSMIALGLPEWAAVTAAVSGAANAVAFGYRPTR